jgi:hypothetical protein
MSTLIDEHSGPLEFILRNCTRSLYQTVVSQLQNKFLIQNERVMKLITDIASVKLQLNQVITEPLHEKEKPDEWVEREYSRQQSVSKLYGQFSSLTIQLQDAIKSAEKSRKEMVAVLNQGHQYNIRCKEGWTYWR